MIQPSCRLYLITPPDIADLDRIATLLPDVLDAGEVAALQIRFKPTRSADLIQAVERLRSIAQDRGVAVILNDDPELAARSGCDGVHIGQGDMSLSAARRIMGPRAMIGVTCHDSRHLAMEAAEAGADYVAFGAFFPTDTKATTHRPEPGILTIWQETMEVPCVAIGGIDAGNAAGLARAGADFVAVSSGIWSAPLGPVAAAAEIAAQLKGA